MATQNIEIRRGLVGVYLDTTEASFVDGQEGKLLYRGYNIHDLAEKSTFEEIVYLLMFGNLPTRSQLDEFDATFPRQQGNPRRGCAGPQARTTEPSYGCAAYRALRPRGLRPRDR